MNEKFRQIWVSSVNFLEKEKEEKEEEEEKKKKKKKNKEEEEKEEEEKILCHIISFLSINRYIWCHKYIYMILWSFYFKQNVWCRTAGRHAGRHAGRPDVMPDVMPDGRTSCRTAGGHIISFLSINRYIWCHKVQSPKKGKKLSR